MAATVVPRKPKAALSVRILAPCKSRLSQCYHPALLQDPVKRTVCLKMAPSPYRLGFTVLHPEQQALVLKVLFDATDDGAFRFESAETVNIMYKPWPEGPGKSTFALRGWMQFTTAKNAKEFIKHWSRVIQARLESGGTPFLVAVEHSMTSLNSGHSVQRLMLSKTFLESSGVTWGNIYRALSQGKSVLPPGDVKPSDNMQMPEELGQYGYSSASGNVQIAPVPQSYAHAKVTVQECIALQQGNDNDFKIGARTARSGNWAYGQQVPFGASVVGPQPPKQRFQQPPNPVVVGSLNTTNRAHVLPIATPIVKTAAPGAQLQPVKAPHLNAAAPAFVPRSIRAAAPSTVQGTDSKPAVTAGQPTMIDTMPAASPDKSEANKEGVPYQLHPDAQNTAQPSQQSDANVSAGQPQLAALATSPVHTESQAAMPAQGHAVVDAQSAAESRQPAFAIEQPTVAAAQLEAPADQPAAQSPQSAGHHAVSLSQPASTQQLLAECGPSDTQSATAQAQSAEVGSTSGLEHAASSAAHAGQGLAEPALEDATEREGSTSVVLSEESVKLIKHLCSFLIFPKSPVPVTGASAFQQPTAKMRSIEMKVHQGSEMSHNPPGIWVSKQQVELQLWESFGLGAQQ